MQDTERLARLGLVEDVALLRAAIRRLACAHPDDRLLDLAELRQQVDSLCVTLRTDPGLDSRDADAATSALTRVLDELDADLEPAS